jgi:branched-chain amino acid transport system substrate-binding protein
MNRSILLGTIAALCLFAGCQKPGGADGAIVVGEFASLTGKEATFGMSSHEGTQLAVEQINAEGGVLGRPIKLVTEDNQSKAGESATVVSKMISRDGAVAILGEVASSRSLEGAPICQESRVPMISPASTNPKVTRIGNYIFRVCFIDPFQGTVMANFATQKLKLRRVAVLTDVKSDYSKGLAKFFEQSFAEAGGEVCSRLDFNGGDKDFKAQLTTIKGTNPEAVFLPGYYTDTALICRQAKEVGLEVPFLGGDGWESEELVKIGKEAMEGHYFSTHYTPDAGSPKGAKFVEDYKNRYGGKTPDTMAALGFDSALVLAEAIRQAGTTEGSAVREKLAQIKDFEGATGRTTINEDRDATKSAVVMQVKGGKFQYVDTVKPKGKAP